MAHVDRYLRPVRDRITVQSITVKARVPPPLPISGVILRNLDSGPQLAEKCVLVRINHNADVSAPDNQIARKRFSHAAKGIDSVVKVARGRVLVRESCASIDVMHQMGAVQVGPP